MKSNQFLEVAMKEIPRLLGQLNRNPSSRTYGSFDRAYWHYRTNDISCCRYQEAVYTLALLYCFDFKGNDYYHDDKLLEWIRASLRFTASIQKRNGSFDEWYINEGSYVGTAFLVAALGQTLALLRDSHIFLPEEEFVLKTLEKAATFLINTKEETVLNQVSGAIFAIASVGYLRKRKDLITFAEECLNEFISRQNEEGWWSEYGGPDIGYLTLTASYLEKYQKLTSSKKADASILKAKSFIQAFINPDHTAGGEYMSRNTEYIIPSTTLPYIGALLPAHLDDRYLCYILYNWIETGLQTVPQTIKLHLGENYFSESSLLRVANKLYFLIANGKKGGSFRLYAGGKVYYDSGLEITSAGKSFSTGILDDTNQVSFQPGNLRVTGLAKKIKEPLMETKIAIIFKFWQFLFGQISFLQKIIKDFLRPRMISYSKGSSTTFERTFQYDQHSVTIIDSVRGVAKNNVALGLKAAYSAVPSSKYAPIPEITSHQLSPHLEEREENDVFIIKRTFSFDN